jgi:hypothetical protein
MPFLNELLRYRNKYFIETNTHRGDTIDIVNKSGLFMSIYGIESSKEDYDYTCARFKDFNNITIFNGTSKTDLSKVIYNIDSPITFWIDSESVFEELELVKYHNIKTHTIMINVNNSINMQNILKKIYEINEKYIFKVIEQDNMNVFIACIEEPPAFCVHSYLRECTYKGEKWLPPGFGDFLRGTIALYKYCKEYNYKLYIDSQSNPLFQYLEENPHFVKYNLENVLEYTCHSMISFENLDSTLINNFKENKPFACLTNGFYTKNDGKLENWGSITEDCAAFMRQILTPNDFLKKEIFNAYKKMNIDMAKGYNAIHMRFGDDTLIDKKYNENVCIMIRDFLTDICTSNPDEQFVFLCDSEKMGQIIHSITPGIFYWNSKKVHLGNLDNESAVLSTMVDFFIIANADAIIAPMSGFSKTASLIFNKPIVLNINMPYIFFST